MPREASRSSTWPPTSAASSPSWPPAYAFLHVGLIAAVASVAGHYIGSGLAIKNGSKIVRPAVVVALALLTVKVGSELLFPEFWN